MAGQQGQQQAAVPAGLAAQQPQVPVLRMMNNPSAWNNQQFIELATRANPLYTVFTLKATLAAFGLDTTGVNDDAYTAAWKFAFVRIFNLEGYNNDIPYSARLIVIGELLAAHGKNTNALPAHMTEAFLCQSIHDFLEEEHAEQHFCVQGYQYANTGNDARATYAEALADLNNYPLQDFYIIERIPALTYAIVSLAKRGNTTERYLEKVEEGLVNDFQLRTRLEGGLISKLYTHYSSKIGPDQVSAVYSMWLNWLPAHALRLTIIVRQMAGTGLTGLIIVGRAMKLFPGFPWNQLYTLSTYANEFAAYEAAARAVGNNVFAGFVPTADVFNHQKFKNLSYVAKELLIQCNGETSLRNYRGWTPAAKMRDVVQEMIRVFKEQQLADLANIPAAALQVADDRITAISDILNANPTLYA